MKYPIGKQDGGGHVVGFNLDLFPVAGEPFTREMLSFKSNIKTEQTGRKLHQMSAV